MLNSRSCGKWKLIALGIVLMTAVPGLTRPQTAVLPHPLSVSPPSVLGRGPSGGDPVTLATGEEEFGPSPDLVVYNPQGPPVVWTRSFRSARGTGSDLRNGDPSYEDSDYGVGWTHRYNVNIYDKGILPSTPNAGKKAITTDDGVPIVFTAPDVPSQAHPEVRCIPDDKAYYANVVEIEWLYSSEQPLGIYRLTFQNRTQWLLTCLNPRCKCYQLTTLRDRTGHAINFHYTSPTDSSFPLLLSITASATGSALLQISRDTQGAIASITDIYGRTISYHVGTHPTENVFKPYAQAYRELDSVSQIALVGTRAADHYRYGYRAYPNGVHSERVPMLHTVSVPSPAGAGWATMTLNYHPPPQYGIASQIYANGTSMEFLSTDAKGRLQFPSGYTKVISRNAAGVEEDSFITGYGADMGQTSLTNGDGSPRTEHEDHDPGDPFLTPDEERDEAHQSANRWSIMSQCRDQFGRQILDASGDNDQFGTMDDGPDAEYDRAVFPLGELKRTHVGSTTIDYTWDEPSGLVRTRTLTNPSGHPSVPVRSMTTYRYNALGNPLTIAQDHPASLRSFFYTDDGNYHQEPAVDQPLRVEETGQRARHYRYDTRGNVIKSWAEGGKVAVTTYTLTDQVASIAIFAPGQAGSLLEKSTYTYLYPGGSLTSIVTKNAIGKTQRGFYYKYDPEDNLLQISGSRRTIRYRYNSLGQRFLEPPIRPTAKPRAKS